MLKNAFVESVQVPKSKSRSENQVIKKLFKSKSKSESEVKVQEVSKKQEVIQNGMNQVK